MNSLGPDVESLVYEYLRIPECFSQIAKSRVFRNTIDGPYNLLWYYIGRKCVYCCKVLRTGELWCGGEPTRYDFEIYWSVFNGDPP